MLALCREHRLEHRTKHIALRYFLARELQQRGQLRLAYVASEANTADVFTKALAPGDHQRFCTLLVCFALLDWSCDPLFSPILPMGFIHSCFFTVAAQRDHELHSLHFSTAFLQGSFPARGDLAAPPTWLHWVVPAGTQWSLQRPVYGLRLAPREWHDTLMTTLMALGFAPSTPDPSLFLRTDTSLPPFYVLVYVNDLVFTIADTEALTLVNSELPKRHTCTDLGPSALWLPDLLATAHSSVYEPIALSSTFGGVRRDEWVASCMGLVLGGRGPVVLFGHADASWVDDSTTQRSSQGYTFSLGFGSISWRSTRSSSVLSSSCEAEIYAGDMAA
ncbi:unnamed protein product [Closterium sp. NIES-53]